MQLSFEVRQYIRDYMRQTTFAGMAAALQCDPEWLLSAMKEEPIAKRGKMWGPEEEVFLLDQYGQMSFSDIAAHLNRSQDAVKSHLRLLLHMEDFHEKDSDFILLKRFGDLVGFRRGRMVGTLRKQYGLPIHEKGITDKPIFVINVPEAIVWLEAHQDLFNGLKVSEELFPDGFPQWMLDKIERDRKDQTNLALWAKDPISEETQAAILEMHGKRMSSTKIAEKLGLSREEVCRFLNREGEKNWLWKEEELQFIRDNWKTMDDKAMAEALHRHIISVRIARLDMNLVRRKRLKRYTKRELKYIKDHYQTMTDAQIGEKLGRTANSIAVKRNKEGLLKKPQWEVDLEETDPQSE